MFKHILSVEQFDRPFLDSIFKSAKDCEHLKNPIFESNQSIMASIFYEVSTRTRMSFESAALRLGLGVITTEAAAQFSSAAKGETLSDTIRNIHNYCNVIVLRHPIEGSAAEAARVSNVPIINAGDGPGEHPTQTLTDLYTIQQERGQIDGLSIAMIGDNKHGRTVHSLAKALVLYNSKAIYFVSPDSLRVPPNILQYLADHGIKAIETTSMDDVISKVDVAYMTRIQKERFSSKAKYEKVKGSYVFRPEHLEMMPEGAILMHPLPRVNEISEDCDHSPKAAYFRQSANGVPVRMAILRYLLGK
ncbi:MAG: aspartate carbamoyltransferase [bacterium]